MSRTRRAIRAFEAFKGERPSSVRRSRLPDQDVAGWEMGPLVGVAYEARRDGETARYFHEFKKSARPKLVASDDGRRLYIDGGNFKVTDRGVEDMPNLFVVNPSERPRSGKSARNKGGSTMARRARRKRRSTVSIFTSNPRRRRRAAAPRRRRAASVFRSNPRRRRSTARRSTVKTVYRRNPARRTRARRKYRRNPVSMAGVGKLQNLILPAVFIGLGGVLTEVALGYMPIPMAWKTGPQRYLVKGAVGVGIGLILANGFKQKRLGYFFAAGAVAIATHDFVKTWMGANVPSVKLGYINPGSVVRFNGVGQYARALPGVGMGQYGRRLRSQFGNASTIPNARQPGGEMNFAA